MGRVSLSLRLRADDRLRSRRSRLIEAGFRQDLAAVLAEARRPAAGAARRLARASRGCRARDGRPGRPACRDGRRAACANACGTVLTGAGRHAAAHQLAAELLDLEAGQRRVRVRRAAQRDARRGRRWCAKRGSSQQVRRADLLAEAAELAVVDDAEEDLAVAGVELVVRRDVGMGAAEAAAACVPEQSQLAACGTSRLKRGVEQRDLDALARCPCARARAAPAGCR